MNTATRQKYKMIATLLATTGGGLPIWTQPLRKLDYTDVSMLGIWLFSGIVFSFISLFFINLKRVDMISSFVIGYIVAVVLHFVGGIMITNYVHNQLSLALLIAAGIGAISGFAGHTIWKWIRLKK